jgi:hypothetical protein
MRIARPQSRPIGHRPALLAVLLALVALASAPAAFADVGETIIQRCTHGQSLSGFPPRAYRRALKELSADAEEYTDCASLIRRAELAAASHGGGGGGLAGTVATVATPAEQRAVAHAAKAGSAPVRLDGAVVHPGVVHASIASALSTLPTPLLAVLALMLAGLLATGAGAVRRRIRAGRSD